MRRLAPWGWTGAAAVAAAATVLAVAAAERGTPGSLLPHGYCFTWNPTLLWTHVASDSLIGAAYVSIPLTLLHLVRKRTDLPFNWIVVLFAIFIVSCGATHLIEVWTVWNPDYWLAGNVKVVTAAASVLTATALVGLVPKILAIPTVAQLSAAKRALEAEVAHRRTAEEALLQERAALERRVEERTAELARATETARAAHAEAEEANRLKDQFLAKVSHELRTPLQSTLGWAQVLQLATADPPQIANASARILHNVRAQARLIDDLLDISRILSGKFRLDLEHVDAAEVVARAVEVVRPEAAERGVALAVDSDGTPAWTHTDPVRLEQVVWNLLNNAVQASAPGSTVRLSRSVSGSTLHVDVVDSGRGIDAADLPHIFEPFRQGRANGGGSSRGLGLGLAIARTVVDQFGGRVTARSEGAGRGATFSLQLPLATAPAAAPAAEAGLDAAELRRLAGLRVLYVEDEPDIAEAGRQMLESFGASVALCLGFDAAAARIEQGDFDVLLSDLNLGAGRTAFELLALLRAGGRQPPVPAVVLSAYGRADDRDASLRAGFALHLVKPADAMQVARALVAVVADAAEANQAPS